MRRVLGSQQKEEGEIDLTPMLDVVFIMLIFFIVTATFVKEMGLDVNTPDKNQQFYKVRRGVREREKIGERKNKGKK